MHKSLLSGTRLGTVLQQRTCQNTFENPEHVNNILTLDNKETFVIKKYALLNVSAVVY